MEIPVALWTLANKATAGRLLLSVVAVLVVLLVGVTVVVEPRASLTYVLSGWCFYVLSHLCSHMSALMCSHMGLFLCILSYIFLNRWFNPALLLYVLSCFF